MKKLNSNYFTLPAVNSLVRTSLVFKATTNVVLIFDDVFID